jgi:prophage DNA circulation protein
MTYEEMEKSLVALRDNQVVQGALLGRLELAVERNAEAIARNTEAIARNSEAIEKLADGFILLQAAVKGLAETVERFVKGLENNGHRRPS